MEGTRPRADCYDGEALEIYYLAGRCFFCQKAGHRVNRCPLKRGIEIIGEASLALAAGDRTHHQLIDRNRRNRRRNAKTSIRRHVRSAEQQRERDMHMGGQQGERNWEEGRKNTVVVEEKVEREVTEKVEVSQCDTSQADMELMEFDIDYDGYANTGSNSAGGGEFFGAGASFEEGHEADDGTVYSYGIATIY